jgi:ribosome hibernation promoting factor
MTLLFTGRKADLTPELKTFTEEKLARLERILHETPDAHVVLTREKHRRRAEIVVHARIGTLKAGAEGAEFEESLGLAIDRLLAQARKQHSKIAKGRKRSATRGALRGGPGMSEVPETAASDESIVVPMGIVPVRPMSVEEALVRLQDLSDPFLLFRDADTLRVCVLFRRRDNRYGLVETET